MNFVVLYIKLMYMYDLVTFTPARYIEQFEWFDRLFIMKTKLCIDYLRLANLSDEYDTRLQFLNFHIMCKQAPSKISLRVVQPKSFDINRLVSSDFFATMLARSGFTPCTPSAGIIAPLVLHERGVPIGDELRFFSPPLPVMLRKNEVGQAGISLVPEAVSFPQRNKLKIFSLTEMIDPKKYYVVQNIIF